MRFFETKWPAALLWPLAQLYRSIISLRNVGYSFGILRTHRLHTPVISIGNLNTGGTGKTPHTEMLLHLLKDKKTVVVSRGYGRKSEGVIEVRNSANAEYVGDEPLQMKRKFPDSHFIVAEKRTEGIEYTLKKYPDTEVILLDDAFQHRSVKPGCLFCSHNMMIYLLTILFCLQETCASFVQVPIEQISSLLPNALRI